MPNKTPILIQFAGKKHIGMKRNAQHIRKSISQPIAPVGSFLVKNANQYAVNRKER